MSLQNTTSAKTCEHYKRRKTESDRSVRAQKEWIERERERERGWKLNQKQEEEEERSRDVGQTDL